MDGDPALPGTASRDHELAAFLRQDLQEIAAEYERIFSRATEDPGTAGDEGEENWAAVLRQWLPETYKVLTKGRILAVDGTASPQIDVLVLRAAYPPRLLNKKMYLAHGVAAAFECKTTLRASHLREAAATAALIRGLSGSGSGTPRGEMMRSPVYGVLAHSHSWRAGGSTPRENVDQVLEEILFAANHPADLLDLVCVADLACWQRSTTTYLGPLPSGEFGQVWDVARELGLPADGAALTGYQRWRDEAGEPEPNALGVLIAMLLKSLAWDDVGLRPIADYFQLAKIQGTGQGRARQWATDVYSDDVAAGLRDGAWLRAGAWSDWSLNLP